MGLTVLMLITLIILLVFSQSLTVRIYGTKELSIKLSFTLFSIELTPDKKKKKRRRVSRTVKELLKEIIRDLLPRTDVRMRSLRLAAARIYSSPSAMIAGAIALPILLAYVKSNSGTFITEEESDEAIDIFFTFQLASLFISLIKASYHLLRKKKIREK